MTSVTRISGDSFSIATPFHLASYYGLRRYFVNRSADEGALSALLSTTINLPHLCGLGGDCIILRSSPDGMLTPYNGTGRTGRGHCPDHLNSMGHSYVPRRGLVSAMVYGAPSALKKYSNDFSIDVSSVVSDLKDEIGKDQIISTGLRYFLKQHREELQSGLMSAGWLARFKLANRELRRDSTPDLFRHIAAEGFSTFYTGTIGARVSEYLRKYSESVFHESDISAFAPVRSEAHEISFFGARVSMHAVNTPWIQLCVSLKVVEQVLGPSSRLNYASTMRFLCDLSGAVDHAIRSHSGLSHHTVDDFDKVEIVEQILAATLAELDRSAGYPASFGATDTIFLAVAQSDGTVVGMTSSIFTPFGSMVDPGNVGTLLSNRAHSFALESAAYAPLRPGVAAPHTTNVLIVENDRFKFALGTTGGLVQTQVLIQLLYRIIACGDDPQSALDAPRFANMGWSEKHQSVVRMCESSLSGVCSDFTIEPDCSIKFGVAQIAGLLKASGQCFAAVDPRGEGAGLAV